MARYLLQASYTTEGIQGILKDGGTARVDAVGKVLAEIGGSLESFYFAFGEDDAYVIADFPDNVSAAAVAMAVAASGAVKIKTIVLLTPEEIDRAAKTVVHYRAPGK